MRQLRILSERNRLMLVTFIPNVWLADTVAAIITLAVAVLWLRIIDALAHRG